MPKLISIVISVYNEEKNIPLIYEELMRVWRNLREDYDYEIVFVNDGSEDHSSQAIERLANFDQKVKLIEFSRNFGKETGLTAGLHHAKGEAAIMIDGDLQHPPELIPDFLKKWEGGAEIVIGIREENKNEGLIKKWGSSFFYKIMSLIGETKIVPRETDYRIIDKKVICEFNHLTEKNRITRGLIDWLGFKKDYICFRARERKFGKATYSISKLINLGLSGFVTHSLFPLKLAGYLGIFITSLSGILGIFVFTNRYILKDPFSFSFSGTAILAIFILFLIGIVLICLGLIALYIANIHGEVVNRPIYVIRKTRNIEEDFKKEY